MPRPHFRVWPASALVTGSPSGNTNVKRLDICSASIAVLSMLAFSSPGLGRFVPSWPQGSGEQAGALLSHAAFAQVQEPVYPVSGFDVEYVQEFPWLPNMADYLKPNLERTRIQLGRVEGGYIFPPGQQETVTVMFGDIVAADETVNISAGALSRITHRLAAAMVEQGWNFFIAPSPEEIEPATGADLRSGGSTRLTLVVCYDGPYYPISHFEIAYAEEIAAHPGLMPVSEIMEGTKVKLVPTDQGYVHWRPGVEPVTIRLSDTVPDVFSEWDASAVQAATLTVIYEFAPNALGAVVGNQRHEYIPPGLLVGEGQEIRVLDRDARDAAADDMVVHIRARRWIA